MLGSHDADKPGGAAAARERSHLTDLRWRQGYGFVPDAGDALDQIGGGVCQNVPRMRAIDHQWRGENDGAGDLIGPRSFLAPLAEMPRRVVGMTSQKASKGQRRVVAGARFHTAILEPANRFTGQLVGPGARFSGGFVRAMKLDHDLVLG